MRALVRLVVLVASSHARASASCHASEVTADLATCGQETLAVSEKRLNATDQTLLHKMAGDSEAFSADAEREKAWAAEVRENLVEAQRSWLAYRKRTCDDEAHVERGSLGTLIYLGCMADMADERTRKLSSYVARP